MLTDILTNPHSFSDLTAQEQSKLISEARYFNMLAQLKPIFENCGLWSTLPSKIRQNISSAYTVYNHQQSRLQYEKRHFQQLFSSLKIEWIYLKGAAYHLAQYSEFNGRLMSDIDILVTESSLPKVEKALHAQGWLQTHINDYDQKFYRQWSQEIPPMRHLKRRTELDLHFNILPKTLKESPSPDLLLRQTQEIVNNEVSSGKILNPAAMVIHCAIHLFYESDFSKGVRDLYDLHILLTKFSAQPEFWEKIMLLQTQIGNGRSVYYALRYCQLTFQLSIPQKVEVFYQQYKPNYLKTLINDFAFKRALISSFPDNRLSGHHIAVWILYIRGHLKRMPLKLLIPHLIKKSTQRWMENDQKEVLL
ncbi:nucleotidyltransferase family protein [Vibrio ziniensis]|uniref:Nucleotidyltransferase family protein n=1 Tax=Vibrio ziniensis TaxID=2711221 RepID=A0A6G7CMF8_9VIBR|nr:nucleotidyltransferase family protein [Vibrio ziniensis]QIH43317.1 nucleotidyltransferase family protein [Vibrio ziniensis]